MSFGQNQKKQVILFFRIKISHKVGLYLGYYSFSVQAKKSKMPNNKNKRSLIKSFSTWINNFKFIWNLKKKLFVQIKFWGFHCRNTQNKNNLWGYQNSRTIYLSSIEETFMVTKQIRCNRRVMLLLADATMLVSYRSYFEPNVNNDVMSNNWCHHHAGGKKRTIVHKYVNF